MISFTLVIAAAVSVRGAFLTSGVDVGVDMADCLLKMRCQYSKTPAFDVAHRFDAEPESVSAIQFDASRNAMVAK
jgi:hypothetical protein